MGAGSASMGRTEIRSGGPTLLDGAGDCCYDGFYTKVLLGLLLVPTTMAPVVRHIPSWRRRRVSICHLAKFDLQVKTQSGYPGQAMVASFDVTIFLEALLGRSFAPPPRR